MLLTRKKKFKVNRNSLGGDEEDESCRKNIRGTNFDTGFVPRKKSYFDGR